MNLYEKEQQIIRWLKEYNYIKASIVYLNESIEDIVEAGMGIQYDKDVLSKTNNFSSVVENAVIKMDKEDLTNTIKVMTNIIKAVDTGLKTLDDIEKIVITNSCIKGQFYYQFIHTIRVSERTAKRIKKEGLKKLAIVIFGKE